MIQRIQTVHLFTTLLVSLVTAYLLGESVMSFNDTTADLEQLGMYVLIISSCISALDSLITILLFKKRKLQLFIIKINIFINVLLLGLSVYLFLNLPGENSFSEKGIGVIALIVVAIAFLFLANRSIKKDEDLVKSVDRLR